MLIYCKNMMFFIDDSLLFYIVLLDKEKVGLQYIGGYVLYKLYKKYVRSEIFESQYVMVILKVGKLEYGCEFYKLVLSVSCGGLWCIIEFV